MDEVDVRRTWMEPEESRQAAKATGMVRSDVPEGYGGVASGLEELPRERFRRLEEDARISLPVDEEIDVDINHKETTCN